MITFINHDYDPRCDRCLGYGYITWWDSKGAHDQPCPSCGGSGKTGLAALVYAVSGR